MTEELDKLIDLALTDGQLTDKEKQVLFKKAEALGVDIDEFEMVLDAKLFQKTNQAQPTTTAATKTEKYGNIKKCPSCGDVAEPLVTRCKSCGHDFRNIQSNSGIQKLFELLNAAEGNRTGSTTSMFGKLQSIFGVTDVDKNKLEIISSFPIPNAKEDMIEFLSLAMPKTKIKKFLGVLEADADKIPNMYARTWKGKCEQIIMKARFAMKDDKKTLDEIEFYAKQLGIK